MNNINIVKTKIGYLQIESSDEYIESVKFVDTEKLDIKNNNSSLPIINYFNGLSKDILCKYNLNGTEFQKKVWNEIKKIPFGSTKTYSDIATAIGKPTACRAVANACGKNKLLLIIPCHRVVGQNYTGGYEAGIEKKKWLLNFEKTKLQQAS